MSIETELFTIRLETTNGSDFSATFQLASTSSRRDDYRRI
jgi:hypothetical protein